MGASIGVLLLGAAAMLYQSWYKSHVLKKMDSAFQKGYDPILNLTNSGSDPSGIQIEPPRPEQQVVESIVRGKEAGRYFLVLGSKGSGKSSMFIEEMQRIQADGCAFFDAHSDTSITVDRFSEAINYSMNRDYLGNLLGLSDLSGMSVFQSLERALHKLEQALIRRRQREGKPAIIIMNNCQLLPREEEGFKLLHLFQQRAERWAANGTATFVFISDDYFVFDALRKASVRMDTLTFRDLTRAQSLDVLRKLRQQYWGDGRDIPTSTLDSVYRVAGGRIALLNNLARRKDITAAAEQLVEDDTQWLLSKTGIIEDHDDDVMDEQKWSTCSWLLFTELAKRQAALEDALASRSRGSETTPPRVDDMVNIRDVTDPSRDLECDINGEDCPNPHITWGEVRQVMTRPDFVLDLDHLNIIHIDRHHRIRADSMPLLRAFRNVIDQDGFAEKLESVMDRVSAIESLGRTRELVWKEQGPEGRFLIRRNGRGQEVESWTLLGGDERLGREAKETEDA
ncbi:hypothetical protein K437DRAFT_229516 [Tilletiaria anomala UBC 951]|uniref:AAA protein C-terminal winged helix domain-containing protein n=1 Tax=Tilletiaria anomala (strain ATCC 24038 / CBS 436.72 / UBC 951) TaxID=1037660 RepID=A0A066VE54_TILAU|nr:uncharacterized protein K437DRAFT_229516 [Tilletiaria anomala UBC 951]KDN36830.1 hypothetical protein K437DRAFT_229516 [Tilletiaria anomala UBC 951]